MLKTTSFKKALVAASLAVMALQANAVSIAFAPAPLTGNYVAPTFLAGSTGTVETGSIGGVRLAPLGVGETTPYGVVTLEQFANLDLGTGPTFTFLWGSPDISNTIEINDEVFTGASLLGVTAANNGLNSNSLLVTISDFGTSPIARLTTGQIAFELAVPAPIPEPETYALMLAGLGVVGFMARRRKAD